MSLSQTSVIFFYILAGFLIYVTAKGQLGAYLNIALGNPSGFKVQ